jgi:hypothetical protein
MTRHSIRRPALVASLAFLLTAPRLARAQQYPLLDSVKTNVISAEISGDAAYDHIRVLSAYHRPQGSDTLYVAAQYVERMARTFGLDSVRLIMQPSKRATWNPGISDLWLVDEHGAPIERITSSIQDRIALADRSRPANVTADLVDLGAGTTADMDAANVAGKIVLVRGNPGDLERVMAEAVQRRGAAGVIWYPDPYTPSRGFFSFGDQPTMVPWLTLSTEAINGKLPTFAFVLSLRQGIALHNRLAQSKTPLRAHAVVRSQQGSTVHPEPWMPMVEGIIRGTDPGAGQDVVLTAHMQEEEHSANDDASGCASMLEIARAVTKLINEGVLPRPKRTIRFWWTTENESERRYFADHPEILKRLWVDINQDMVGADQSIDVMRSQNVNRVPFSRFHFLNDVMESVIDYMVAANSSNITQYRNGYGLYPKPHLAHNGSQDRYAAQAVWYQGDSDHQSFVDAPAGIPAVGFGNEPDRFIHSNLDDLFAIDRTQLGRNAVSAALIAYTMASADSGGFHSLAAETIGRGEARLGRNVGVALQLLAAWPDKTAAYYAAADQVRYAGERERRAIRSLGEVASSTAPLVAPLLAELDRREAQAMREVRLAYAQQSGNKHEPPARTLSATETELASLTPVLVGTPMDFWWHRDDVRADRGVNGYLSSQILATIDGHRTGLDLYRIAAAEVREAGAQYYGTITPDNVLHLLRSAEQSKLFRLDEVHK